MLILSLISYCLLSSWLRTRQNGTAPPKHGRHAALSAEGQRQVAHEIEQAAMSLNAIVEGTPLQELFKRYMLKEKANTHVSVSICMRTIKSYIKRCEILAVNAVIKTSARVAAIGNIRTPLAYICALMYVLAYVAQELYFSSDDTSVFINNFDKPRALTNAAAKKYLESHNLNTSTVAEVLQKRVVTISYTISGGNKLTCTVYKVYDRNFPSKYSEKPMVYEPLPYVFVMLCGANIDDTIVNMYMYQLCIIPCCEREQRSLIDVAQRGLRPLNLSTDSQPYNTAPSQSQTSEDIAARYSCMCLASDGAHGQITAIQQYLVQWLEKREVRVLWLKYGAGMSMSHSPNDNGPIHPEVKRSFRSNEFRHDSSDDIKLTEGSQ